MLELALRSIVNRHESLRTVFVEEGNQLYQKILDKDQWQFETREDLGDWTEEAVREWMYHKIKQTFDLSKDHMFRAHLSPIAEGKHLLVMVTHHIASDGWSASILIDEVWAIYQALMTGKKNKLPVLDVQYADYSIWQRKHNEEGAIQRQLDYWKTQLNDVSLLELPTDFPRPATQSIRGANKSILLSKATTKQLLSLAQGYQTTPFMLIMAACKVFLTVSL